MGKAMYRGCVMQDKPMIWVNIESFEASSAEEAWQECQRRVQAAYKPEDVRTDRLYGSAINVADLDDAYIERRPAFLFGRDLDEPRA